MSNQADMTKMYTILVVTTFLVFAVAIFYTLAVLYYFTSPSRTFTSTTTRPSQTFSSTTWSSTTWQPPPIVLPPTTSTSSSPAQQFSAIVLDAYASGDKLVVNVNNTGVIRIDGASATVNGVPLTLVTNPVNIAPGMSGTLEFTYEDGF